MGKEKDNKDNFKKPSVIITVIFISTGNATALNAVDTNYYLFIYFKHVPSNNHRGEGDDVDDVGRSKRGTPDTD